MPLTFLPIQNLSGTLNMCLKLNPQQTWLNWDRFRHGHGWLSQAVGSCSFSLLTSRGGQKGTCKEIVWWEPERAAEQVFQSCLGFAFFSYEKQINFCPHGKDWIFKCISSKRLSTRLVSPFLPYSKSQGVLFFSAHNTHDTWKFHTTFLRFWW